METKGSKPLPLACHKPHKSNTNNQMSSKYAASMPVTKYSLGKVMPKMSLSVSYRERRGIPALILNFRNRWR
jgi:hypothetical protein